jgi:hypothetical protein
MCQENNARCLLLFHLYLVPEACRFFLKGCQYVVYNGYMWVALGNLTTIYTKSI